MTNFINLNQIISLPQLKVKLRTLLAIAAECDFDYDSLNVKTAFLYPPLHPDDKVWMKRSYGLTDAPFNCYSDSKSHTGVTVHFGQFSEAVIISFCGKQSIIADSSTEAEFIGAHQACKIIAWV